MQSKQKQRIWLTLIAILTTLLMCIPLAVTSFVHAEDYNGTTQNIPGASGSAFTGSGGAWVEQGYGARVTLVYADTGNAVYGKDSIDFSPINSVYGISLNKAYHFGKYCKSDYRNDDTLLGYSGGYEYTYAENVKALDNNGNAITFNNTAGLATPYFPRTVNWDSTTKVLINEVKQYFTNYNVLQYLAGQWSMSKSDLESGKYKLLIEPLIFFNFPSNGVAYVATVTEAALWNKLAGGIYVVGNWTAALYANQWPSSMILETDEFSGKYKAGPFNNREHYYNTGGEKSSGYGFSFDTMYKNMGINTITWDAPPPTTVPVYYHIYDTLDHQVEYKKVSDFDTSTSTSFTPSTAYGTPIAACVETKNPTTAQYTPKNYRVREVGNPDKTDKLTTSLTIKSSDAENDYSIHVKVLKSTLIPVYYYYYDGSGNQTGCSSSAETTVNLNTTYTPPTKSGYKTVKSEKKSIVIFNKLFSIFYEQYTKFSL